MTADLTQGLQICNDIVWQDSDPAPLPEVVPVECLERLCGAFQEIQGRSHCQAFRPFVYRSQYLMPVVIAACQQLDIGNLYLKRTQVKLIFISSCNVCE